MSDEQKQKMKYYQKQYRENKNISNIYLILLIKK